MCSWQLWPATSLLVSTRVRTIILHCLCMSISVCVCVCVCAHSDGRTEVEVECISNCILCPWVSCINK